MRLLGRGPVSPTVRKRVGENRLKDIEDLEAGDVVRVSVSLADGSVQDQWREVVRITSSEHTYIVAFRGIASRKYSAEAAFEVDTSG